MKTFIDKLKKLQQAASDENWSMVEIHTADLLYLSEGLIKMDWETQYVESEDSDPDKYNRWLIVGRLKIDCSDITPYEYLDTHYATIAHIYKKGTVNANFIPHPSFPNYEVRVCNVLEKSMLFNTGASNATQFFDTVEECKKYAQKITNFHFNMLLKSEVKI